MYLDDKDISFLLAIAGKSGDIYSVAQSKLEEIYKDIDYTCLNNIGFDFAEIAKNIDAVHKIVLEHKDIEEEVSGEIVLGYITREDQPKSFEKLFKYREYLEQLK